MRQGNGAELLGANDPRSATIGLIYVAPSDDRESVLAAILTQEKLGRKQIAIVLPEQNRAFQRPVDFDGLKNMRRKLQAELVIIAPSGPGPAEFARQRHFAVYSTTDSFVRSLRDTNQPVVEPKRGLFGRKTRLQPADAAANNHVQMPPSPIPMPAPLPMPTPAPMVLPPPPPEPAMMDDEDEPQYSNRGAGMPGGAAMGFAASAGAGFAMNAAERDDEMPTWIGDDDGWDDLPAAPPPPSPAPTIIDSTTTPARDGMAPSPVFMDGEDEYDDELMPPPQPGFVPVPEPEPAIIQFPQAPRRSTRQLPVADDEGAVAAPVPLAPLAVSVPVPAPSNVPPAQRRGSSGGGTPPPARPPRRRRGGAFWVLALVALLLLSLLVCVSIAFAAPNSPLGSAVNHIVGGGTPTATVTIIPASQNVNSNFAILAVTGTPNSGQRQVQARELTYTTPVQSKTVNATGVVNTPATHATGTLTLYNASFASYPVGAGTIITGNDGVAVKTIAFVNIPAAVFGGSYGTANVAAQTVNTGANQNIRALDINKICCGSNSVLAKNFSAFGGGHDPQHYTVVQQSDVATVANPLVSPAESSALKAVQALRHTNEQFVGQPQCTPNVKANPAVGSKSPTVTVAVSATCTGEVYDQSGALALAVSSLQNQANKIPGPTYKLVGKIVTNITKIAIVDTKGTISLIVNATGVWEYNFTTALKAQLAKLIEGKSQSAAQGVLAAQTGVSKVVSITLSTGTTLPTDPTQITIVVQDATGLSGTPTATGSPTTITPTVGPGTAQPGSGSSSGNGNGAA
jgi:hypothetical protein